MILLGSKPSNLKFFPKLTIKRENVLSLGFSLMRCYRQNAELMENSVKSA